MRWTPFILYSGKLLLYHEYISKVTAVSKLAVKFTKIDKTGLKIALSELVKDIMEYWRNFDVIGKNCKKCHSDYNERIFPDGDYSH